MAAITKSWTNIADAAVDPDSPVTTGLVTALRDNAIYVYEWLGASFTAGAQQDHSHDGVDSALVEVGPNLVRNPSWAQSGAGWSFTDYSGGSHAIVTTAHIHGDHSLAITSTVLANGGGEAISNAYLPCAGGDSLPWRVYIWASVANVSAHYQAVWYDEAKSQISATNLVYLTDTPTSATRYAGAVAAPAGARFVRVQVIGAVPALGSATGTVRFAGLMLQEVGNLAQSHLVGAVGQAQLKTTSGSVSTSSTGTFLGMPGGEYAFALQLWHSGGGAQVANWYADGTSRVMTTTGATPARQIYLGTPGSPNANARERYVQASPPYDLGNGPVPLFMFAAVAAGGAIVHAYVAPDPPWANNGPTDIRADYYAGGKGYRWGRRAPPPRAWLDGTGAQREAYLAALSAPPELIEITQALKQADMPLLPHPFLNADPVDGGIVLLDPVSPLCGQLLGLHEQGELVIDLLTQGYLRIDNEPLDASAPPGVTAARVKWRDTAKA